MRAALAAAVLLGLAAPAAAQEAAFRAPSGNIFCMGFTGGGYGDVVDCEILSMETGPLQARPSDCDLDWGHRFSVPGSGPAGMVCAGDTVQDPRAAVLPYGSSLEVGAVTCTSRETGLTCVNRDGHGFSLARRGQSLF